MLLASMAQEVRDISDEIDYALRVLMTTMCRHVVRLLWTSLMARGYCLSGIRSRSADAAVLSFEAAAAARCIDSRNRF